MANRPDQEPPSPSYALSHDGRDARHTPDEDEASRGCPSFAGPRDNTLCPLGSCPVVLKPTIYWACMFSPPAVHGDGYISNSNAMSLVFSVINTKCLTMP